MEPPGRQADLFVKGKFSQKITYIENQDGSKADLYTFTINFNGKPLQLQIR